MVILRQQEASQAVCKHLPAGACFQMLGLSCVLTGQRYNMSPSDGGRTGLGQLTRRWKNRCLQEAQVSTPRSKLLQKSLQ